MIKLIHCADIHLKAEEKSYGLGVLREIVDAANREKSHFLLVCGDLFDSFADAEALRRDVAQIATSCACEILFIPGNHEELGKTGELTQFDLGKIKTVAETPFKLITREAGGEAVEFLAVPHQPDYSRWRDWKIPAPAAPYRVALVHATVENMAYTGPDNKDIEVGGALLGSEFFSRNCVTYGALGHIHGSRRQQEGNAVIAYPGSATVWRTGEAGPRKAVLVEISKGSVSSHEIELKAAGRYRRHAVPLALDAALPDFAKESAQYGGNDLIEFVLSGIIENESLVHDIDVSLQEFAACRGRRPIIDKDGVGVFPGLAKQPLAAGFLKIWQAGPPQDGTVKPEAWSRVRELALEAIRARMEVLR
jgi:DNA repair exonuclease SbcCD nuclease subunit